ncbi:hypothetical protein DL766_004732 [Monosporascus sp. MC13-8B]|uniref:Chromosome partition protein Smc n=1 Tax=Monosporascus cannonballus TaxID=155416 RepID=A0ABY0GYF0_9PEZI|nr:hypothetical protein DL762_009113 [Monosporascus cannonballus]RYO88464.1 hypothetical protein DL763_005963 [Monosporascus cannonballus]RYP30720.1 hypothetical protein DL766_004732 [Monosporascus sp. MC13-8B]
MQTQEIKTLTRSVGRLQQDLDSKTEAAKNMSAQSAQLENAKKTLTGELHAEKAKVAEKDKRLQENAKAVSELQGKLKTHTNSINKLKDTVKERETEQKETSSRLNKVSKELEEKKAEMAKMSEKLKALSQYSCTMNTASDEAISKEVGRLFTTVHDLARTFFSENLSRNVLDDDNLWKSIHKQIGWLPLPASNTPDAKQMRIAACIAALGSRFFRLIFVPVYLQSDTGELQSDAGESQSDAGELSGLLSNLAAADPPREAYLRSVLLDVLPEEQIRIRKQRTAEIVNAVCTGIGRLLEEQKRAEFRDRVEEACKAAVECWQKLRLLKTKVDPFMPDVTEDTAEHITDEYWLPLGPPANKSPEPNGTAPVTNEVPNGHKIPAIEPSDVKNFIWPAFIIGERIAKLPSHCCDPPPTQKLARQTRNPVSGVPITLTMEIGITMAMIFGAILLVALIWALFFGVLRSMNRQDQQDKAEGMAC